MPERMPEMPWDTVPMPAAKSEPESTLPVLSPEPDAVTATEWEIEVDAQGATDTGLVRERNEDQFLIAELERQMLVRDTSIESTAPTRYRRRRQAMLLAVADGMGGHAGGRWRAAWSSTRWPDICSRHSPGPAPLPRRISRRPTRRRGARWSPASGGSPRWRIARGCSAGNRAPR